MTSVPAKLSQHDRQIFIIIRHPEPIRTQALGRIRFQRSVYSHLRLYTVSSLYCTSITSPAALSSHRANTRYLAAQISHCIPTILRQSPKQKFSLIPSSQLRPGNIFGRSAMHFTRPALAVAKASSPNAVAVVNPLCISSPVGTSQYPRRSSPARQSRDRNTTNLHQRRMR